MKRGVIWIALTCLILTSLVLASCSKSATTSSTTSTSTTATTSTVTTSAITTKTTATTTTTAATGHWWDKLGIPQYGGKLTIPATKDPTTWDPYLGTVNPSWDAIWLEQPTANDWTLDPEVYDYTNGYTPPDYCTKESEFLFSSHFTLGFAVK